MTNGTHVAWNETAKKLLIHSCRQLTTRLLPRAVHASSAADSSCVGRRFTDGSALFHTEKDY